LIQSKARILGFDRVIGLAESISILKKIQNGIVLVKKKKQKSTDCYRVLLGQPGRQVGRVTPSHDFSYFFHQLDPIPAPD